MLKSIAKKTVLTIMIGANIASMTTVAYAGSKSSSRSSYSSSSSKSSSYSSSSRSSYSTSTPSKTAVYTPVTKAIAPKPAPYKQDTKKTTTAPKNASSKKVVGQSYSAIKKSKSKGSSNFLTWVLLAWILSDSNESSASTSTTKEVVVDCKQWLKDNVKKPSDLSNDEYQKIKKYCESVTK